MPRFGSIFQHGARIVPAIVSDEDAARLLASIDAEAWSSQIGRRVQHYGFRYDYRGKSVPEPTTPFPAWANELRDAVAPCFATPPTQCIINEYTPGQGIGMHSDAAAFGPVIVSVTLGAGWEMRFRNARAHPYFRDGLEDDEVTVLPVASALILTGRARSDWMHGICRKESATERGRRVSATFRTVNGKVG